MERFNRAPRECAANLLTQFARRGTWTEITGALDHRVEEYNRSPHFGENNRGLSPVHCVEAVHQSPYDPFRTLGDETACGVPKGYHLATRPVAAETGEVRG